jgi:hypothetical protein
MSEDDTKHEAVRDRLTATIAMSQTSARLAYASLLSSYPPPPKLGTDIHRGMVQGKDATLGLALCGLQAEHKHGALKHLTPEDMMAIGAVLAGCDIALSRNLGVDTRGNALQ